ncbi:MAG: malto-oligosyltrehalose trehalohydrolase [Gammaproteobacteria bacterium]
MTSTGVQFRVWAPAATRVEVVFPDDGAAAVELLPAESGFFSGHSGRATAGTLYRYRLNGGDAYPDPYSRFQPEGPHGPSMVIDPGGYRWQDTEWRGLDAARQVIYELHIGTFTETGTYAAAETELERLRDLGVTCLELMPVAEFSGRHGWGYDGVDLFAPYHQYGDPEELRRFVDRAHGAQLGVVLDVVYNHIGADGNYLPRFSADYFTDRYSNDWGQTLNYASDPVRQLAIDNAAYWIREFHMDGLRLDATQSIHDPEHPTLLAAISRATREAARPRMIVLSGEDYLQRADLLTPTEAGGAGLDQLWNDDFHHSSRVALTGNHGGYFRVFRGNAQELLSALRHGFLFQGQYDGWKDSARGMPASGQPHSAFVAFTQNHDQVANTLWGQRLHRLTSPGRARTMTALLLLGPNTPLIFMGQEFDASSPFAYFADYEGDVAADLWRGRKNGLKGFAQYAGDAAQSCVWDPCAVETVRRSRLDSSERERNAQTYRLYQDLLKIRGTDAVLSRRPLVIDGAVLGERAFVVRWFDPAEDDRLLLVNLGDEQGLRAIPEPLLAPPRDKRWVLRFSSDAPIYGGMGVIEPALKNGWVIPAESATFLIAERRGIL